MLDTRRQPSGNAPARAKRAAIFDLDGTLIDSAADLADGVNGLLGAHGLEPLTLQQAASLLGGGIRSFVQRAFELRRATIPDAEISAYVHRYAENPVIKTRLYPGAAATLQALSRFGWRLTVCTNKVEAAASRILEQLDVLGYFDAVCGGDSVQHHKPDPLHLEQTLRRAGLHGCPAVMIGDNRADMLAARAYGIPGVFAAWGYGSPDMSAGASAVAKHFSDLPSVLPDVMGHPADRGGC